MSDPCDVCQVVDSFEPWLEVNLVGVLDRWIHRCRSCGFHQVRPRLSSDEIGRLYPPAYFDGASVVGYGDYAREAQRRRRDAFFLARRFRSDRRGKRALDVGCALGFLLAALRDEGFDVSGVDASEFAVYYARSRFGVPVARGALEDAAYDDASFDLVAQKDLLEHVGRPRAHLVETARVMKKGALLWVVTPCGDANLRPLAAVAARSTSSAVPLLDQGHLSFFSESNLRRLFDECGFDVERARAIGVRRGLRALGWLPGQLRFAELASRRRPAATPETTELPDEETGTRGVRELETLARSIDQAVARHRRLLKGWVPYYRLHHAWKALDTLPSRTGLGYDFEFFLRRR